MKEFISEFSNIYILIISFFVSVSIIILFFYFIISNKDGVTEKNIKWHGMFVGMNNRSIAIFSAITLRTFLIIISALLSKKGIEIYMCMVIIISIIYIILSLDIKIFIFESINTGLIVFAIYLVTVLKSYMIEVRFDNKINIIKNFLIFFVSIYTIYTYLRNFDELISRKFSKKLDLDI